MSTITDQSIVRGTDSLLKTGQVNPGLKAWDFFAGPSFELGPFSFLKNPALKGRVSSKRMNIGINFCLNVLHIT